MQALGNLVLRGLVEVYEVGQQRDQWVRVPDEGVEAIVSDPGNWQGRFAETRYWVVTTGEGEAAYRRWSEATGGAWIEVPPLGSQGRVERLRHRLRIPATMPRRVHMEPWWVRMRARLRRR